eukprot:6164868-Pyramimonas_sp.AAC.1
MFLFSGASSARAWSCPRSVSDDLPATSARTPAAQRAVTDCAVRLDGAGGGHHCQRQHLGRPQILPLHLEGPRGYRSGASIAEYRGSGPSFEICQVNSVGSW